MNNREAMECLIQDVVRSGEDDWVGLWELARTARELMIEASSEDVRAIVVSAIRRLLSEGLAEVGDLFPGRQFRAWNTGVDGSVQRIDDEWRQLGAPPNIGEICWFQLTERGRALQA